MGNRDEEAPVVRHALSNREAAELCKLMAADEVAGQVGDGAWRRAGDWFVAAWHAEKEGDEAEAARCRKQAALVLEEGGLNLGDAGRVGVMDQWMVMVSQCTMRGLLLHEQAGRMRPIEAGAAVVLYGAAAAMERAALEWGHRNSVAGSSWSAAAVDALKGAGVKLPWVEERVGGDGGC